MCLRHHGVVTSQRIFDTLSTFRYAFFYKDVLLKPEFQHNTMKSLCSGHFVDWWRGLLSNLDTSIDLLVSQWTPVKPGVHTQAYESTVSTHVAPNIQRFGLQTSITTTQIVTLTLL